VAQLFLVRLDSQYRAGVKGSYSSFSMAKSSAGLFCWLPCSFPLLVLTSYVISACCLTQR
jgi:hypothetical protein